MAFSLLGHYEEARDASQEAFVSAYRSLRRFRAEAKFSTWLYRIVVNECHDARRRRARRPASVASVGESGADDEAGPGLFVDAPDPGAGPDDQAASRELSRQLSGAIERLAMNQRTAFVLRHLHGLSVDEVAVIMRCRVGTVKSHLFRATRRLRVELAPWVTIEDG